jgi:tetratricopeptide (TPR) repeat protein
VNPQINFLLNKSVEALRNSNIGSAELYLNQAQKLQAKNPHILRLLGVIAAQRRQYNVALKFLNDSLKILPKNSHTLSNLGNVYAELKEYGNALDAYNNSIKIDPKNEEAWANKANVLYLLGYYDDSIAHHEKALSLRPDYHEEWVNKGNVLKALKRFDDAIYHYDKALELKSDFKEALWNKSLCLLLLGNFETGLPLYESRWRSMIESEIGGRRLFNQPAWLGINPLSNKTILIYGEQGLGDFIQFSRYVKLVADLGARVILEAPESLVDLMCNLEGIHDLIVKGQDLPPFDFHCPLMSLPLIFKTNLQNIPSKCRYLEVGNSKKSLEWKNRLGPKLKPRVGLVWSGNANHKNDHNRSILLRELAPFLPSHLEYISLQKEVREVDKTALSLNTNIHSFHDFLNDFVDTAILINNLDLVISVDTSVAHLSGALGKRTWILLPYVPDWRWLLDREDSPWYPSVSLYRQHNISDWKSVLAKVKFDLNHFVFND